MTGSAVLDTILGLIFLFYALALLCSGLVEMIANWVKKRAKYLLRGLRSLLEGTTHAPRSQLQLVDNHTEERKQYASALDADPQKVSQPTGGTRTKITVQDVMGHGLIQPFNRQMERVAGSYNRHDRRGRRWRRQRCLCSVAICERGRTDSCRIPGDERKVVSAER
jgi:hypothetical protein